MSSSEAAISDGYTILMDRPENTVIAEKDGKYYVIANVNGPFAVEVSNPYVDFGADKDNISKFYLDQETKMTEKQPDRFRFDHASGDVHEWTPDANGYVFCGNLQGRSEKKFIAEYDWDDDFGTIKF